MSTPTRIYTPAERRRRAALVARGAKQAFADAVDSRIQRQLDAIDAAAADRAARELAALLRQLEDAKNELATARAAEKAADRVDRQAAKDARKEAEKRLRRCERALRR
ncbi:hypothetical protein [Streptomyces radiopugnans]|uniref:Colicin import membrane protein n=1 Tax=Streptomyces radiopugnans TaxID=403935 RepID=A0A1H8ZMR1_9ACTN|nr:hypothetical protein [Streptomyces radiopugnans]SEP64988.1 hypothetical protein SAMN05216481_101591 [Streptomyces radiopugnans]